MLKIKPSRVCVYYRVSTKSQASDTANGLQMQTDLCDTYASKLFNWEECDIDYYCDVGSMYKNKSKPRQLLEMIDSTIACPNTLIFIHDISRLGRDIMSVHKILKTVRDNKCFVISVTENLMYGVTPVDDKAFLHKVIDAECSSDVKSDAQKKRIERAKRNGVYIGCVPYGYKRSSGGKLIMCEKEQRIIREIVDNHFLCMKPREIEEDLLNKKIKKRGHTWTYMGIKRIIKKYGNEKYRLSKMEVDKSTTKSVKSKKSSLKKISAEDIAKMAPVKKKKKINVESDDENSSDDGVYNPIIKSTRKTPMRKAKRAKK
jgi:DNA invertase Pin-like site-specific DNA recombinase